MDNYLLIGLVVAIFILTLIFTINRSLVSKNYRDGAIPGFLSFFLFTVCISGPLTLAIMVNNYLIYDDYDEVSFVVLFWMDIIFGVLYCILAYFVVKSFLQGDGDALFLGYGFLAACIASNMISWSSIDTFPYKSLAYCLIFGLFFYYSSKIDDFIPYEKRYISTLDQVVVGATLSWIVIETVTIWLAF